MSPSPAPRLVVVANRRSGPPHLAVERHARIARAFRRAGIDVHLRHVEGNNVAAAVRRGVKDGARTIVVAGGDGTLSTAAHVLARTRVAMGVLPLGTLNHFARDVRVPLDLDRAVEVVADGIVRRVDVAEVNGRTFINNASIGAYPRMVQRRDRQVVELGRPKWIAAALATGSVLRAYPLIGARIDTDTDSLVASTPFLFIGNNVYDMRPRRLGRRNTLRRGELSVYLTPPVDRVGMVRLGCRALLGRLREDTDFRRLRTRRAVVDAGPTSLRVAIDGEVHELRTPLEFRTRPGALRVLVPGGDV